MQLRNLYYGWVIVFVGALVLATNSIAIFGFGIFLKPLTAQFGWDRGAIAGAMSSGLLIAGVLSFVSGRLSDQYGPRILVTVAGLSLGTGFLVMSQIGSLWQMYLIWGLFMGIGISCSVIPIISTIPRWFTGKMGIALAIPGIGFGLGSIISPLSIQWLISTFGWRLSFIILGFIPFIITIPLAQFLKQDPRQIGLKPYGGSETIQESQSGDFAVWGFSLAEAIKTRRFWVFGLLHFSFGFCAQTVIVHIVPHIIDTGISAMIAASTLSIVAGSSVIGRLSTGLLSDWIGGRRILNGCLVLVTLAFVWILFATEAWMFYAFALVFGLAFGGVTLLLPVVSIELFGVRFLGAIFGAVLFFGTAGSAVGAPLSGFVFDITGSYILAFKINAAAGMLTIILSQILLRYKSKETDQHRV
ncbi:MFS transporter [Chloroflexota bacterium]